MMMPWFWPWGVIPIKEKELKELTEKAEKWDQYAIYDNDKKEEILVKDLIIAYEKLEAVKTWFSEYRFNPSSFKCWKELEEILEGS